MAELPKFVDYNLSSGRRLKDNEAGFRNWLRKAVEYRQPKREPKIGKFVG